MELRQLRYFVKVAETLNFSDAAKAMCVTQSTLSQQIKQLEGELSTLLFERSSHSVALTEAGHELLPLARRTICDADTCVARINDLQSMLAGSLNIGVTYSFSPILTETLVEFTRRYPGVKLNIFYKPMAELMEMLRERKVDFVLAFRPTVRQPDIDSHVLFDNHLAVIVGENHVLASRTRVSLADLSRFAVALPSRGLQARNAFDRVLAVHQGTELNVKVELNEVNILLELVARSNMVTVLAEATAYNRRDVRSIPLDIPANEMEGCVHLLRDSYRKQSAVCFVGMLRESSAVRARVSDWLG